MKWLKKLLGIREEVKLTEYPLGTKQRPEWFVKVECSSGANVNLKGGFGTAKDARMWIHDQRRLRALAAQTRPDGKLFYIHSYYLRAEWSEFDGTVDVPHSSEWEYVGSR